jgi:hypothetical protein
MVDVGREKKWRVVFGIDAIKLTLIKRDKSAERRQALFIAHGGNFLRTCSDGALTYLNFTSPRQGGNLELCSFL